MTRSDQWKLYLTIAFVLASVWTLWPTFQFYSRPPKVRQEVLQARPALATNEAERLKLEKYAKLREKAIRLGLDLQGGMYLLLEVDTSKLGPAEAKNAVDQVMQIIRNRIDQFGVAEPSIQKQGTNRILVQLPGLLDQERAKALIGQTALLEFKLVKTEEEAKALYDRIDAYFARKLRGGAVADSAARRSGRLLHADQPRRGALRGHHRSERRTPARHRARRKDPVRAQHPGEDPARAGLDHGKLQRGRGAEPRHRASIRSASRAGE